MSAERPLRVAVVGVGHLGKIHARIYAESTGAQRERFLPAILAGDCVFAIGYTEPSAGTDLASLTTRAERDGSSGEAVRNTNGSSRRADSAFPAVPGA